MAFQSILWNIYLRPNSIEFYSKLMKTRRPKRKKKDNFNDLLAVSLIALIALLSYKGKEAVVNKTNDVISFILLALIIMAILILAVIVIMKSRKTHLEISRQSLGNIDSIKLNWGQALQHDLLIYGIPIVILSLPIATSEPAIFNDFLQATVAFLALAFLKNLYWGKFIV